jgi:membrane protein YdbS with pleckstrin-like domain
MATDAVKLSVKPVFVGWIALITQVPLQLFFTLWCGLFFGGMGTVFGLFPKNSMAAPIVLGAAAFVAMPIVIYLGKKLNYSQTEYRFYSDRLEFDEGFLTVSKKVIKFRDVRETSLRKGVLQRTCDLGSIYLATLATGSGHGTNLLVSLGLSNVSASGIVVRDISEPDVTFERVRKLVDAESHQPNTV